MNGIDILDEARQQVLEDGQGLDEDQTLEVLRLGDERIEDALALAHEVRMRWCGPEVEVEGIVSIKTGGCPEDCHFCSQSGRFETPVRAVRLDIAALVQAARETAETGATEFCLVAAVRGPDERLMQQVREAVSAIHSAVEINVACSLGILTREQAEELAELGGKLNNTYCFAGREAKSLAENQQKQDDNALRLGVATAASRAMSKAGGLYGFGANDLVVAIRPRADDRGFGLRMRRGLAATVIVKHEQADGGRKVAMPPVLIIRHTRETHDEIGALLDLLRYGGR